MSFMKVNGLCEKDVVSVVAFYDPLKHPETALQQHLVFRGDYFADGNLSAQEIDLEDLRHRNVLSCGESPDNCSNHIRISVDITPDTTPLVFRDFLSEIFFTQNRISKTFPGEAKPPDPPDFVNIINFTKNN